MSDWGILPRIENPDGSIKHIFCDGSRQHVLSWSSQGPHCSEPDCEVNRRREPMLRECAEPPARPAQREEPSK